jgi:hypothetical protein
MRALCGTDDAAERRSRDIFAWKSNIDMADHQCDAVHLIERSNFVCDCASGATRQILGQLQNSCDLLGDGSLPPPAA